MNHTYQIDGMSCQNCVNKVKTRIQSLAGYQTAKVQLSTPQLVLDSETVVPVEAVQKLFPSYAITEIKKERAELSTGTSIVSTYKPLLLIVSFIAGVAALSQYPFDTFSWMLFMRHFMAGFFIVFAFFKLLNLKGFADSYAMYDLLAARWRSWGYIYPFLELGLGVAYLIAWNPQLTGIATILL